MRERITTFLEAINIGSSQFAEEIGVQPSGISHILSGRNNPSLDFVLKVLKRYPDLSTEWLLFGKGNMYGVPGKISGNQAITETDAVNSEAAPEYLSGLFAAIESDESRSAERTGGGGSGRDGSRGPDLENEGRQQVSTYPVDNKHNEGNSVNLTTARMAEKLILIYGDGTFEQFSLRRGTAIIPIQEREK